MKAKLIGKVKKVAAVATGALFVGATLGMASVFASGLSSLPGPFVSSGHVNAVFVVGANAAPTDVLGAIDISAALTASAAATHSSASSGQITVGTLALKSKSSQYQVVTANGTSFSSFTPSTSIVDISNATYTLHNTTKINASWQESFAFSTSSAPFVNGLDVQFPSKSFTITSTLNNRNQTDVALPLMNDTEYLIGSKIYDLLSVTAKNATFGVLYNKSNVLIPSSFTAGTNTVNLLGIAKVLTSTGSINEVEFNINGGSTQTANLSSTATVGKVTLTFGKTILENSTGNFLSNLDVSSATLTQNNSAANLFGFGPYNVSWTPPAKTATGFVFTYTGKQLLSHSFSTASSFPIMDNLSTVSLQPLTRSFPVTNYNVSVSTGSGGTDFLNSTEQTNTSASTVVTLDYTHGLPNVGFGTDFRNNLTTSGYGGPNLLLEHYQTVFNVSSGKNITAASEYIFPRTNINNPAYYTNKSAGEVAFNTAGSKGTVRIVYALPNGRDIALQYTDLRIFHNSSGTVAQNASIANLTTIYNYTASTTSSPKLITPKGNKSYSFDGYNLTMVPEKFTNTSTVHATGNVSVSVLTAKITGPIAKAGSFSIIPGSTGLYATNGTVLSKAGIDGGYLGNLQFNGSQLTYTDPLGATQMVSITENKTNFDTNITTSTKNTSANTWGDYITGAKIKAGVATIAIPAQNYTVALAGAQTVIGQQNYTIGQTVSAGKLLGVNGVSTINAGQLINSNPDMAVLDNSFASSTNNVPVIVIGGPAVNSLADTLLNISAPVYGSSFTNLTGVGANEAVIEMFNNVTGFNNQPALWVAGYSSQGTVEASEVLAASLVGQPIVSLTGNKVVLSTSSSSYTGVTIA
jgi:hypothetical protein